MWYPTDQLCLRDSVDKSLAMIKETHEKKTINCRLKVIIVDIKTLFASPNPHGFPATVQEIFRSSQPERIEIDFDKYGHDGEERIVEDLLTRDQSSKIIFVLVGISPLSDVKEQFQASGFDRYI